MLQQFLRYGAVGAAATAVHYAWMVAWVEIGAWPAWVASGSGAVLGAQVAYLANYRFTFAHRGGHRASWPRFQLTAAAGALWSMGVVAAGAWAGLHYLPAQMAATATAMLLTYGLNRRWTFR